jgi:hypothetical protein
MSRINTSKITGKIRIRIIRPWRGYPVGAVIKPPGAMRQILLQAKDQLGNRVAEEVEEEAADPVAAKAATPVVVVSEKPIVQEERKPGKKGK